MIVNANSSPYPNKKGQVKIAVNNCSNHIVCLSSAPTNLASRELAYPRALNHTHKNTLDNVIIMIIASHFRRQHLHLVISLSCCGHMSAAQAKESRDAAGERRNARPSTRETGSLSVNGFADVLRTPLIRLHADQRTGEWGAAAFCRMHK